MLPQIVVAAYRSLLRRGRIGAAAEKVAAGDHVHTWGTIDGGQYLQDKKALGVSGGTFTDGAWRTRDLNDAPQSIGGGVGLTLASNQFTLLAGFYIIRGSAPGFYVAAHQTRIQNITDAVTAILGTSEYMASGNTQSRSHFHGIIGIGATKTFEVQHRCSATRAPNGFGAEGSFGDEIYTILEILRLAT